MIRTIHGMASDGIRVGARVSGEDGRGLIFVHGVGSTAAIWDAQLRAFANERRCAAIELRGNGAEADPDPAAISREGFVRDVLAIADELRFERFDFVGCSLGGVVGFELWKTARDRVRAFVIVGSFAAYPNSQSYAQGIIDAATAAGTMRAFALERAKRLGLPPERERETIEQMACKSIACYVSATSATWTGDYRDVLPSIDVPTLVLVGERDMIAPLLLSQEIASGIPRARLEIVPNAGHVANADEPERFNTLLRAFL